MLTKSISRKTILVSVLVIALMAITLSVASAKGFERWPVITIDGEDYYWAGAPDGPNGETDVPGHTWIQAGPNKLVAKHFNTGPFGAPQWWSSDAPDGELLYKADVIIDVWTPEKAERYASRGYVHYHEFVSVEDGSPHQTKVGLSIHPVLVLH